MLGGDGRSEFAGFTTLMSRGEAMVRANRTRHGSGGAELGRGGVSRGGRHNLIENMRAPPPPLPAYLHDSAPSSASNCPVVLRLDNGDHRKDKRNNGKLFRNRD